MHDRDPGACSARHRFGERIPYVVVHGEPGSRLVDLVVDPRLLVESHGRLRLHGAYYITKQARALHAVAAFSMCWWLQMQAQAARRVLHH